MSAGLHLATMEQAERCLSLAKSYHAEIGANFDAEQRAAAMEPLLAGSPLGAIWIIGPARAPLGYVLVTFTWSPDAAGIVGWVRELYVRDNVRRRGIATTALGDLARALRSGGIKALHVNVTDLTEDQCRLWHRARFAAQSTHSILTGTL